MLLSVVVVVVVNVQIVPLLRRHRRRTSPASLCFADAAFSWKELLVVVIVAVVVKVCQFYRLLSRAHPPSRRSCPEYHPWMRRSASFLPPR